MDTVNNLDKYFKGQQTNETYICFFRHHWITLLREFLYFFIFLFLVFYLIIEMETIREILRGSRELKLFFVTAFLMLTIYLHRFFIKMFNYFVNTGIITDIRIIDHQKTIFFRDSMDSIDLSQIQNIERVGEGLLPSLLGYGDIKIFLTASAAAKTFYGVPNAKFHFRCMNRQKEARQQQLRERRDIRDGGNAHDTRDITQTVQIVKNTPIPVEERPEKTVPFKQW